MKKAKVQVESGSDSESTTPTLAKAGDDAEKSSRSSSGSNNDSEDDCPECVEPLLPGQPRFKKMKMHNWCGKKREAVKRTLTKGKHTKDKKAWKRLSTLRFKDKKQYCKCIAKIGLSKKGSRITREHVQLLKVGVDKVNRMKEVAEETGYVFLTRKEFPNYAKTRWGWGEAKAKKKFDILLNERGALTDKNKNKEVTLGIEKPKELLQKDAVQLSRESKKKAGRLNRSDVTGLAQGWGSGISGRASGNMVKQLQQNGVDSAKTESDDSSGCGDDQSGSS